MARTSRTKIADSAPLLVGIVEPEPKAKPVATVAPKARAKAKPRTATTAVAVRDPNTPPPREMSLIESCIQAARDKSIDVPKMEALLEMVRGERFNADKRAARDEMPDIVKDSKGENSHYAKLEKISQTIDPIARRHGFTHSYGMADSPMADHYRVICDLSHINGKTVRYYMDVPPDTTGPKGNKNKTGPQGASSSVTLARRVLKTMIWDLTLIGMDNDGAARDGAVITTAQAQELSKLMRETNTVAAQFFEHYGIEDLTDLPRSQFERAKGLLERKKEGAR